MKHEDAITVGRRLSGRGHSPATLLSSQTRHRTQMVDNAPYCSVDVRRRKACRLEETPDAMSSCWRWKRPLTRLGAKWRYHSVRRFVHGELCRYWGPRIRDKSWPQSITIVTTTAFTSRCYFISCRCFTCSATPPRPRARQHHHPQGEQERPRAGGAGCEC